ncbi:hypothetical protein K5D56_07335 [Pseudomonas cichorii]|uniref:Uncharacterized protein n=1 Tax=Pseudomonas lijiangensis TaxID=2995658 RepID=A0ABX8HYI0_9PSED|nr:MULTISPECIES: hypothetical protein [Pseudomonas syringae group]MBX8488506.1 hypothetical protein [Pseudomonas cichorii]MBX8498512.1 hypothetical protein [Pseudomonas lijiangensis]MBX8503420.1 hypothetical protein [Pseudomonas lijiangensis]MBX8534354.1 hypothetical protein [Pseudomonas cichorii]MBX8538951.1 hypothetical protein [Pseudomonas cichorii]
MLSVVSVLLLGASSISPVWADSKAVDTHHSEQAVREQVDKQRDQLSGANKIATPAEKGSAALLQAPVDTEDAPAQVQKP